MNDRIKLNIGGTKFETTRGTLTSCPNSLLAKMFDPDSDIPPAAVSEDGYYFLDACPTAFKVILNWLRYKDVILGKEVDAVDVIPVADYFGLPKLCEKLEAMKKPDLTQNNNNHAEIIRLNVGGSNFEITRSNLTKRPTSKLAKMFKPGSETSPPLTEDGAYFIDCCPKAAKSVLNWIRRSTSDSGWVGEYDGDTYEDLFFAAESFGLNCNRGYKLEVAKDCQLGKKMSVILSNKY